MKRKLLVPSAVMAAIAAALPFLGTDRFKPRIQAVLETSLGRKVDITGMTRFSLWNGPGFSVSDVVIHEDPSAGMEPFAYVSSLNATLSIRAMLRGRWEVSSILLDEPRVNLVKRDSGSWNVRPLLEQTASGPPAPLPEVHVRSGRINFKFGDTKSVLYCANADVDLTPDTGSGVRVRFSFEPARTDRAAQGFGTLSGRGRYRRFQNKPGEADLELELERSALSDIVTLLEGRGAGMRGFLAMRAKMQGELARLKIEGTARLEDIQRFDLLRAGSGNWPLRYRGTLDFPAGELLLETQPEPEAAPVRMRLRGHRLLEDPGWGAIARFNQLPVAALREVFQSMSVALPDRVALEGKLSGVLGYSQSHGLQGMLEMPEASVKTASAAAIVRGAVLAVDGGQFQLLPSQLDLGGGQVAEIRGSYSPTAQSFTWRSRDGAIEVRDVTAGCKQLLGVDRIPLLDDFERGQWRGAVDYEKAGDAPAQWSGRFQLRRARLAVAGLAAPVEIDSAAGSIQGGRLSLDAIRGSAGDIEFEAAYRREPAAARPHRLRVKVIEADVAELERLFLPTLRWGGGLLRTLSFRASPPAWLGSRHLEAAVRADSLWAGDAWLGSLAGLLIWDGVHVELAEAAWQREETSGSGAILLRLARPEPEYSLSGLVRNIAWKGGWIDSEGKIETSGAGPALLRNAKSAGKFSGKAIALPENEIRAVSGSFEFAAPRGMPALKFSGLEVTSGADTFTGQGASENDGRLLVDLLSGSKRLRMAGTVWPFQLEVAAR
ncbi:MAG: AsmA family protein [Acidobacteria bacterium]|nr:AsmA family protein [Acidobacteriota bacterium]